jgi:glycosyltransferase involved in cell wall biosynthesis
MYDLSICVPTIREQHWTRLYDSIVNSIGDYTFELVLCGPYDELSDYLKEKNNVTLIKDYGSPTRAQQIAVAHSTGKYITWGADDGWYLPQMLEKALSILEDMNDKKAILVSHYMEGGELALRNYTMNYHEPLRSVFYPNDFLIINVGIARLEYYKETGGLDCTFQGTAMSHADWGARAQLDGANTYFLQETLFQCTQFVGPIEDHAPIHYAQIEDDQPLYASIWRSSRCLERKVDFNNWKAAPEVWKRRFSE